MSHTCTRPALGSPKQTFSAPELPPSQNPAPSHRNGSIAVVEKDHEENEDWPSLLTVLPAAGKSTIADVRSAVDWLNINLWRAGMSFFFFCQNSLLLTVSFF